MLQYIDVNQGSQFLPYKRQLRNKYITIELIGSRKS